ncbi:MAG: phosphodiester glycosidase family protein [Phascolarctobacterium sp.]|nr:phosphodiester glycosidase family protein [Phascolarctobacterium sp.]MCD8174631.1 phosphodiester glycosidase family protein [Phascolarctobacterium sp.]
MRRLIVFLLLLFVPHLAFAAPINSIRTSASPARVRFVLDSSAPITYNVEKKGTDLTIRMPESSAKKMAASLKDAFIKSATVTPDGKDASILTIKLARDAQYKVYKMIGPHRLVIDIFKISIVKNTKVLSPGVTYTYMQDEMNGRQIRAYLLSVAPDSGFELRPFSAAGACNGRSYVSKQAAASGLRAAVNASYFDSDGWVVGCTKDRGIIFSAEPSPHSAYVDNGTNRMIVKDVAYTGKVTLQSGKILNIKGMNRSRIAEDLVLFNEYYGLRTKTNPYGREIKIKNGKIIANATGGNMSIEPGTVVLSGHGANATALASARVGDQAVIQQTLGVSAADMAKIVVGAGPMLLEGGQAYVRSKEEHIAGDIANGRAPRTGIGIKKDGTVLVLVVDGRSSVSAGMTLQEFAQYFLRLGADSALNFDGGGSSVMVIDKRIVNRPSDGQERPVSIGLGLFKKI